MRRAVFLATIFLAIAASCTPAGTAPAGAGQKENAKPAFQHEEGDAVREVAFSEDGRLLFSFASCGLNGAVGDLRNQVWVWDRVTGALVKRVEPESIGERHMITRRPAYVECTKTGIRVRDVLTGKRRDIPLRGIDDAFHGWLLSEEFGLFFASNETSANIRGWDLKTGEPRFRFPLLEHAAVHPLVLSKSGKYLAICFEYLWNGARGRLLGGDSEGPRPRCCRGLELKGAAQGVRPSVAPPTFFHRHFSQR